MSRSHLSSQSIAQWFSLAAGLLLIPGLPGALFGLYQVFFFRWGEYPEELQARVTPQEWTLAIGIVAALVIGCVLLWGYVRWGDGRPVWGGSLLLWLATALYNGAPLVLVLSQAWSHSELPWLLIPFVLCWLTAVVLALVAAALDLRARFTTMLE